MILTHHQLVKIVTFAENEDVYVNSSYPNENDVGETFINVGRESDRSMIRVSPDGEAWIVARGSRQHTNGTNDARCWCGEKHG